MRFFLLLFVLHSFAINIYAQSIDERKYSISVNLTNVTDDKLNVIVRTPPVDQDVIDYHFPKIVPGTYSIYDFGRFISHFRAYDYDGNLLKTDSVNANSRRIHNAQALAEIRYVVEDTYDTQQPKAVFEPAGLNIEEDKNFVINHYTLVGYLEGMKNLPYEITYTKPQGFYGATALSRNAINDSTDRFFAPDYFELADNPLIYARPDTASFKEGNAEITVAVYSPKKLLSAAFVKENVQQIIKATRAYLGGTLPVDRYAFIIYLSDQMSLSGSFGALEHSYSSLYYLPEYNPRYLAQSIRDIATHEFLHIITPLNIHAEQIHNFDFINPKMSEHLWLYEGVTEYFATHIQASQGLISEDAYLAVLLDKINNAKAYKDDLPFTQLSKKALAEHADQYPNVYQKGALIGMALDLKLMATSNGRYSLRQLMADLSKKYGKTVPFKDEDLFRDIVALSNSEVGEFLQMHVDGPTPLPYADLFALVGATYQAPMAKKQLTMGNVNFTVNAETQRFVVTNTVGMNDFGKALGYQAKDELLTFNKQKVDFNNYLPIFEDFKDNGKEGEPVVVTVLRNVGGKIRKVKLKARAVMIHTETNPKLSWIENPTEAQLALRQIWLGR